MCHFVVEQVYSGAFEESMRWCACAVMAAGYSLLVHARLCSVQRILPNIRSRRMRDQAQLRVSPCTGFGICSAVH